MEGNDQTTFDNAYVFTLIGTINESFVFFSGQADKQFEYYMNGYLKRMLSVVITLCSSKLKVKQCLYNKSPANFRNKTKL